MSEFSDYQMMLLEKPDLNCEEFSNLLCDYADNDLPMSLRARVETHAGHCEQCKDLKDDYLKTIELASELKPVEVKMPEDARLRVRAALREKLGIQI